LADDYYYGRNGKSKDRKKAVEHFRIAVEAGHAYSQYSLGWCYEKGQGVEQDAQEAEKLYRKAAEQGEEHAIKRLATLKAKAEEEENAQRQAALSSLMGSLSASNTASGITRDEHNNLYDVFLVSAGNCKLAVVKAVKFAMNLGLKEAKEIVDSAPCVIKKSVSKSEAEAIKKELEEEGATVKIQ
jgi:large subunit ribosomal protein L7/L12